MLLKLIYNRKLVLFSRNKTSFLFRFIQLLYEKCKKKNLFYLVYGSMTVK